MRLNRKTAIVLAALALIGAGAITQMDGYTFKRKNGVTTITGVVPFTVRAVTPLQFNRDMKAAEEESP